MRTTNIIAISGTKGGIGKTTLAANLGGLFQSWGKKVLFVDCDSQPALSDYYPLDGNAACYGIVDVFKNPSLITNAISTTAIGCDIVLSNDYDRNIETELAKAGIFDVIYRLGKALKSNIKHLQYDYVIIDCPGVTSTIHQAAIMAADLVVCPVTPDQMSLREFPRGTLSMIKKVERNLAEKIVPWPDLAPIMCVIYRQDLTRDAENHAQVLRHGMRGIYDALIAQTTDESLSLNERTEAAKILNEHDFMPVNGFVTCQTAVPQHVIYKQATTEQIPVHQLERSHKDNNARKIMHDLALELLEGIRA